MSDFDDEPTKGRGATDETVKGTIERGPASKEAPIASDDWDDDWDDDAPSTGKRDLTLVYAVVAAAIIIVLAVVLTRPNDDNATADGGNKESGATTQPAEAIKNWQGDVGDAVGKDGADAQKRAESAPGIYIWTDFNGWHLRQNGASTVAVTVAAPQVRAGETDAFAATLDVTLPAGQGSNGVDLDLGNSETATFAVTVDGLDVPPGEIFLGGAQGVASANPVEFTKS